MQKERTYIAIDLKSFYASVECAERGLDPLTTNLVVADESRTEKTICLAVTPSLKAYGIPGRARLFEVVQKVREINAMRRGQEPLSYIVAPPRMSLYMDYSTRIFKIYLRYIAPEDIHVYSVDEVFMDVTNYLGTYKMTARELAVKMIHNVLDETGITATAGIGPNLYLCKIAMDVEAKHVPADKDGVRIAELTEMSYRERLWSHEPLTDFWRVGKGIAKKLNERGIYTMGDIARCSLGGPADFHNPELLYKLFGVNAELLIDHAWGWEPCTIEDIKNCRPRSRSLSEGQVLSRPYSFDEAKIVVKEMANDLAMRLFRNRMRAKRIEIVISYDTMRPEDYGGAVKADYYGRMAPKPAHGTFDFGSPTSSIDDIEDAAAKIFESVVNKTLYIRRLNVAAVRLTDRDAPEEAEVQLSMFDLLNTAQSSGYENSNMNKSQSGSEKRDTAKAGNAESDNFNPDTEWRSTTKSSAVIQSSSRNSVSKTESDDKLQEAIMNIQSRYGKNAIVKARDFEEGATALERNARIGGHKA